jgi:signal transduction histidine kinase
MARLRLQSQLLISTLLIISALTGTILLIIRQTVRSEIAIQVTESAAASVQEFRSIQQQLQSELSRTAALLAEIPTLKALMTTRHMPTIQDGSTTFWNLAGSNLFLLADPDGKVMALHVTRAGLDSPRAQGYVLRSLNAGEDSAWWYAGGRLYWVFLRPITAGVGAEQKQLGWVAVGYEMDSGIAKKLASVAGSKIVLASSENVIASTFPPSQEREIQRRLVSRTLASSPDRGDAVLGNDEYQVTSVDLYDGPGSSVQCYVFIPLARPLAFLRHLNQTILIIGISAVLLALLLLRFVAATITRPLDNLVSAVRALATGNYTYSITPRGSSEVAELGESFSKMRGELLASQQKQIEAERIGALGRAAHSISHDLRHHLAALVANAEFLYEAEKLKLDRVQIYGEIQDAAEQITELLDSLRDLGRARRNLSPTAASLDHAVQRAIDTVLTRSEFRGRFISINTTGKMTGLFDQKKMERAFLNLALNACEATARESGKISFDIVSAEDFFQIRVADNGPGIPESIRGTLFDAFVSAGKSNGTGLGLAIVSKIIHDHGGSIVVESTSGSGTVFLINLPRLQHADLEPREDITKIYDPL